LFLFERIFDDCLERLELVQRRFERSLLIGCPDPGWPARLQGVADAVMVRDPGELFAEAAGGERIVEDHWHSEPQAYDLVMAIGTLDTVDELPLALRLISEAMADDALLIGVLSGGDTLPQLRSAMRAADLVTGAASPHVHPRIEASALAPLLSAAGFAMPVVDVDRVLASYRSFGALVSDLRRMGATNILQARSRTPMPRAAYRAAQRAFEHAGVGGRTIETFEILHFAGWKGGQHQG